MAPLKRFGVGTPMKQNLAPSVPPRMAFFPGGKTRGYDRLPRPFHNIRILIQYFPHVVVLVPDGKLNFETVITQFKKVVRPV